MLGLFVAAVFIALNGFFVAAEFALVKVRATQLHTKAREGHKSAVLAQTIIGRLDRYLAVTQFGVTLASLILGWVGEPALARVFRSALVLLTGRVAGEMTELAVTAFAFLALTFAHVLFGELVPKLIAIQRSEATALAVARPLRVLFLTFRPFLFVLEKATGLILRGMGLSADVTSEGALSEDEIVGILAADTARTRSGKEKSALVERVLRFAQRAARHAMVPRVDVLSLPLATSGKDALAFLRTHEFSRVLLTKGRSLDDVAGYLYAKDFLLDSKAESAPGLGAMRRDVLFVPETQGLVDVLRDMQRAQVPIAVVVDEYGGTSGIVTMEDLLEEIVGEIRDEFDKEPARIVRLPGEEAWEVDGRAAMDELRTIGVEVAAEERAEPVGAIVLERLGRLPRVRDRVVLGGGAVAEITSLSRRRVTRVRVTLESRGGLAGALPTASADRGKASGES